MFKEGYYYYVIHRDFATTNPVRCIILVEKKMDDRAYEIRIKKIFESCQRNTYVEELVTSWFEDWCTILKEFKYIPTKAEMLVYAL